MNVLSTEELNIFCQSYLRSFPFYGAYVTDYFSTLYYSGMRSSEPLDNSLFSFEKEDYVILQPKKRNNLRQLPRNIFSDNVLKSWQYNGNWLNSSSLSKYSNIFNKYSIYGQLFVLNKDVSMYVFRYNYVKQLQQQGLTVLEIQHEMGWTNLSMVYEYLNAEIYYI